MLKIAELLQKRARAFDEFKALAEKETLTEAEQADYETRKRALNDLDAQIDRAKEAQALSAGTAQPVAGQETAQRKVAATVKDDRYEKERSLVIGAAAKMMAYGGGNLFNARQAEYCSRYCESSASGLSQHQISSKSVGVTSRSQYGNDQEMVWWGKSAIGGAFDSAGTRVAVGTASIKGIDWRLEPYRQLKGRMQIRIGENAHFLYP